MLQMSLPTRKGKGKGRGGIATQRAICEAALLEAGPLAKQGLLAQPPHNVVYRQTLVLPQRHGSKNKSTSILVVGSCAQPQNDRRGPDSN